MSAINKYKDLQNASKVFMDADRSHDEIEKAGNEALATLYGAPQGSDLNFERAAKFSEKVVSSSSYLPPERLPPTSDAGRFHSYRVYLQVQGWLGNNMPPTEWGWGLQNQLRGPVLKPKRMMQAAAPACLLKIIRCNCAGRCNKNTCSCKKNALHCTMACGHCKGITCTNRELYETEENNE